MLHSTSCHLLWCLQKSMYNVDRILHNKANAHHAGHCCEPTELDLGQGAETCHSEQRSCRNDSNEQCAKSRSKQASQTGTSLANRKLHEDENESNGKPHK